MTAQEKLEVLQNTLWDVIQSQDGCNPAYERNQVESLKAAIFALEKQIPARAIPFCKGDYICPTCRTILNITDDDLYVYGIEPPKYCDECGQALDWSGTDKNVKE